MVLPKDNQEDEIGPPHSESEPGWFETIGLAAAVLLLIALMGGLLYGVTGF
jgi:hypothetical protein